MEFRDKVIDLYYDAYFKEYKGHDYTDEQVTMATTKADLDDCVESIKSVLYKHFNIKGE